MPRQALIDSPGTLHHIIVRGIERKKIFHEDKDRNDFLDPIGGILMNDKNSLFVDRSIGNLLLCVKGKGITIYGGLGLSYVKEVCEGWRCRRGMSFQ